jgi:hypothetical protein
MLAVSKTNTDILRNLLIAVLIWLWTSVALAASQHQPPKTLDQCRKKPSLWRCSPPSASAVPPETIPQSATRPEYPPNPHSMPKKASRMAVQRPRPKARLLGAHMPRQKKGLEEQVHQHQLHQDRIPMQPGDRILMPKEAAKLAPSGECCQVSFHHGDHIAMNRCS